LLSEGGREQKHSEMSSGSIGIKGQAFGVCLSLQMNQDEILHRVLQILPPSWTANEAGPIDRSYTLLAGTGRGSDYKLFADGKLRLASANLDYVVDRLETDIQIHLGKTSPRYVFVHAGVVGWRDQAIVIPGRSMSGKSTLVAAFLRAGASYYSDEFAILDAGGQVHPYARPLALRQPAGRPLRCPAESLGSRRGNMPLYPGLVLVTRYRSDARWKGRQITRGRALLELMRHSLPVRHRPEAVIQTLQKALAQALVLRGIRGEAEDMVKEIMRLI
jgi:hypothetical protein